jgi:predicted RNA binding protein YcfA (HicA-like mRNA interferase family)
VAIKPVHIRGHAVILLSAILAVGSSHVLRAVGITLGMGMMCELAQATVVGHNGQLADFCRLLEALGFSMIRTSGSHRIYGHHEIPELVNVQDVGGEAKPYQIRQVLRLVERYNLRVGDAP